MTIRKAFVMYVNSDKHDEYQKRHDQLWPEMKATLKEYGAANYSIHLLAEQNMLFGYVEIEDEQRWQAIADTEICQKWWRHMKDVMPSNPDNSPVSVDLREVFYLA